MKKVLIVLSILLLTACGKAPIPGYTDTDKFKEEYEALNNNGIVVDIKEDVVIDYLSVEEVVDFLENKTGIIYFGFPNCPWCRNILPVLIDIAIENEMTIHYFNPRELRGSDDENFNNIMAILNDYLSSNENGEKTLYVPDVYFAKDGVIQGHHLGSATTQTNPYVSLTSEQKTELENIYIELVDKLK